MAERMIVVCDVCGEPASQSVGLRVGGRSLTKDLCDVHLAELTAGARQAKPGRRRVSLVASPRPTRRRKPTAAPKSRTTRRRRPKTRSARQGAAEKPGS
jgi:hypothetical protein